MSKAKHFLSIPLSKWNRKEMVCFGLLLKMIERSLSSNSEGSSDLCQEAK